MEPGILAVPVTAIRTKLHITVASPMSALMIYGADSRGIISMGACTRQPRWSQKLLPFHVRWE
jgi:hypothetical protein